LNLFTRLETFFGFLINTPKSQHNFFFQCTTVKLAHNFANPSALVRVQPDTLTVRRLRKDASMSKPASVMDERDTFRLVKFGKAANLLSPSSPKA
jgi:hypothetical protein